MLQQITGDGQMTALVSVVTVAIIYAIIATAFAINQRSQRIADAKRFQERVEAYAQQTGQIWTYLQDFNKEILLTLSNMSSIVRETNYKSIRIESLLADENRKRLAELERTINRVDPRAIPPPQQDER